MMSSLSPVEEEAEPISESSEGEVKRIVLETTVEYPRPKSFQPGELISRVASACHIESVNEIWIHTDSELVEEMNKTSRYITHLPEFAVSHWSLPLNPSFIKSVLDREFFCGNDVTCSLENIIYECFYILSCCLCCMILT
jgi:hypothetical protein